MTETNDKNELDLVPLDDGTTWATPAEKPHADQRLTSGQARFAARELASRQPGFKMEFRPVPRVERRSWAATDKRHNKAANERSSQWRRALLWGLVVTVLIGSLALLTTAVLM